MLILRNMAAGLIKRAAAYGASRGGFGSASIWAILFLGLVNLGMFMPHYLGAATFPWDFLAGYHAQTFGWMAYPGLMSPGWVPWADLGFPNFLSIQSGAGYAPFVVLKILGVTYSVYVATVVQAAHAWLGSAGVFFLLRTLGFKSLPALLAALAYQLGAGFYSNQQHSDIIRATALLPWLVFSIHPRIICDTKWGVAVAAFVLFQFLVAGYPGNIVAAVYTCAVFVVIQLATYALKRKYLILLAASVASGVLMSLVKWLPLALNASYLIRGEVSVMPMEPAFLLTTVLPYDVPFLSSDLSMRSVWLPLALLWGAFYFKWSSGPALIGFIFISLSLFVACLAPLVDLPYDLLPGGGVSRFLVSDWRPTLHLGLTIVAASGWAAILKRELSPQHLVFRTVLGLIVLLVTLVAGLAAGYSWTDLVRPLSLGVALVAVCLSSQWVERTSLAKFAVIFVIPLIICDGAFYQLRQDRAWRTDWTPALEIATFGTGTSSNPWVTERSEARRPERYMLGFEPVDALSQKLNTGYNQCWYELSYCVFGYNNLKLSPSHVRFQQAVESNGGRALLDFMRRPQQLYVITGSDRIGEFSAGTHHEPVANAGALVVHGMSYGIDSAYYALEANEALVLVENEIWWPGWTAELCGRSSCMPLSVKPTSQALRSWEVPPGRWEINLRYEEVHRWQRFAALWAGIVLILLTLLAKRAAARTIR